MHCGKGIVSSMGYSSYPKIWYDTIKGTFIYSFGGSTGIWFCKMLYYFGSEVTKTKDMFYLTELSIVWVLNSWLWEYLQHRSIGDIFEQSKIFKMLMTILELGRRLTKWLGCWLLDHKVMGSSSCLVSVLDPCILFPNVLLKWGVNGQL